jgi:membrane-associated phospholipid phosphatase
VRAPEPLYLERRVQMFPKGDARMRAFITGFILVSVSALFAQETPSLAADQQVSRARPEDQSSSQEQAKPKKDEDQNATPGNTERTALEIKPGAPVIKNKDLYEGPGYIHPFVRMPKYVLRDQKAIWTSPFHSRKSHIKYWAIFGAATGALIATDKWTVKDLPNSTGQVKLGTFASRLGAAYSLIPITGGFYFIGSAAHNDRFRETGLMSFETLVDTTIVETVIKAATHRDRPLEGDGTGAFWSGKGNTWNASFPSGHVINTWALASLWAHQDRHTIVVPVVAYGIGAAVIGARLAARKHFPGDVLPAAAMGWFIGDYVFAKRHNSELDPKKSAIEKILAHVRVGGSIE